MNTNQIMCRSLSLYKVEQRTKDGMFNATSLLSQWNEANGQQKSIAHYFENTSTQAFIQAIKDEEKLTYRDSVYVVSRARADRGGGTWMHPLLFIDFAMWLNPAFKVKVLKFVSDQMLTYRNEAGEAYKRLASSVSRIVHPSQTRRYMQTIAKGINYIVTGTHHHLMRNQCGTEQKQREYFELERQVAMLIDDGFLATGEQVVAYLRKKFISKYF